MLRDTKIAAQQRLGGSGAQANDYFRMERCYFSVEPWPAGGDFRGVRFFVHPAFPVGFPFEVLYSVGEVNFPAVNACFRQSLVQEAACRPDERFTFPIFLVSGLFANKNDFRVGRAFAEDGLRCVSPQIASSAVLCRVLQFFQRCIGLDGWLNGF